MNESRDYNKDNACNCSKLTVIRNRPTHLPVEPIVNFSAARSILKYVQEWFLNERTL